MELYLVSKSCTWGQREVVFVCVCVGEEHVHLRELGLIYELRKEFSKWKVCVLLAFLFWGGRGLFVC